MFFSIIGIYYKKENKFRSISSNHKIHSKNKLEKIGDAIIDKHVD